MQIKTLNIEHPLFVEGTTLDVAPVTVLLGNNRVGKTLILEHIQYTQNRAFLVPDRGIKPNFSGGEHRIIHNTHEPRHVKYLLYNQPEKGLHPDLHCQVAENIVEHSRKKEQYVIVETHSDIFALTLRAMVAEGKLRPEDVSINFVIRDTETDLSRIEKVDLDYIGSVYTPDNGLLSVFLALHLRVKMAKKNIPYENV